MIGSKGELFKEEFNQMNKLYTILKSNNHLYKKTQNRLKTVTFNCEICETKCATLGENSIYCPKCLQRFPIQFRG